MTKLLHADLTYRLRGIGFQIHNELGPGHNEADYETALEYGMVSESIPFLRQPVYQINYRGHQVGEYRPDMVLADGAVILDLKATAKIEPLHQAQVLSYLAVTNAQLGLIMNFGAASLQVERFPNFLANRQPQQNLVTPPIDGLYPELTRRLLDSLFTVQRSVGPGFLHQIYRRATRIELSHNQINHIYLKELPLRFQGQTITQKETRLFWIEERILLATVAMAQVTHLHTEKLRWAMRETGCQLGLIANFYPSQLEVRFIRLSAKT